MLAEPVEQVQEYPRFLAHLRGMLNGPSVVYAESHSTLSTPHYMQHKNVDPWLLDFFRTRSPRRRDLKRELGRLRAIKSPAEQSIMRAAANITADAHRKVRPATPCARLRDRRAFSDDVLCSPGSLGGRPRGAFRLRRSETRRTAASVRACRRFGVSPPCPLRFSLELATRPNALAIHYVANNAQLEEGEMVLMDAGCEYK